MRPLLFALLLLLVAPGCIRRGSDDAAGRRPRLRWVAAREPAVADPARCRDRECLQHAALTLDGLFRADKKGTAVPALAEQWSWSDERTLLIRLKRNVRWSDGEPLTAANVIERWRFLVARCRELPAAVALLDIVEARAVCAGAPSERLGALARDAQLIEVHLDRPRPLFPLALAQPATWPVRETILGQHPVALGPFRLETRGPGGWSYGRNPTYHANAPPVGGIDLRVLSSPTLRLQSFGEAGADIVDDLPPELVNAAPTARREPTGTVRALVFHGTRRGLPLVLRRSLSNAIDRQEIVRLARWPFAATEHLLTSELSTTTAKLPGTDGEWEKARVDLAKTGTRLTLAADGPAETEIALALQAQWLRRLDVKVEIVGERVAAPTLSLVTLDGERLEATARFGDVLTQVGTDLIPARRRVFEALLAEAASADSPRDLGRALAAAEAAFAQDLFIVPLLVDTRPVLVADPWKELGFDGLGLWDVRIARFGY